MKEVKVSLDIVLRHVKLSDAQVFFDAEQDAAARKNFMTTPTSVAEVKADLKNAMKEYRKKKPSSEKFTIVYCGEPAGWIRIAQLNVPHFEHRAKVDLLLHKDFRGKGIMSKVLKRTISYAFKTYKLKRLEAWTRTHNKAVHRLNEKVGFKLEGTLRKNKCKNGKYLDDMIWAIVR